MFDGNSVLAEDDKTTVLFKNVKKKKKLVLTSSIDEEFRYISMVGFSDQTI